MTELYDKGVKKLGELISNGLTLKTKGSRSGYIANYKRGCYVVYNLYGI